jgi:predicted amino acid-binding ACT domain protein
MTVRIRKVTLWRTELEDRPGALADLLEPLAQAGADLQIVLAHRLPGTQARVEIAPVSTRRVAAAAQKTTLTPARGRALHVLGQNRPGLGNRIARALAESRVNIAGLAAQVAGPRYSAVFEFDSEADLDKASDRIRAALVSRPLRRPHPPAAERTTAPRRRNQP